MRTPSWRSAVTWPTALRERAPELARARIEAIPNGVDVPGVRADADATPRPIPERYALFVGKLAKNKGAHALVDVAEQARLEIPLVVIGDGPERASVEQAAAAAGRDVRIAGLARQARGIPVAASRGAADLSVGVARAAEPRADRSERAVGADRGHEHRRYAPTSSSTRKPVSCRPQFQDWRTTLPALRPMHRFARGSEAQRRKRAAATFRHSGRDRPNGSALSGASSPHRDRNHHAIA